MSNFIFGLRCPDCGKRISDNDTFCPGCGVNLDIPLSDYDAQQIAQHYFKKAEEACERGRNIKGALTDIEIALQYQPDSAEAHNLHGLILDGIGRTDSAIKAYREAIEIDPNFEEAKSNLEEAESEFTLNEQQDKKYRMPEDKFMLEQLLKDSITSLQRPTVKTFRSFTRDNSYWAFLYLAVGGVLQALINAISFYLEFRLQQQRLEESQSLILEFFVNNMHNPMFIFLAGIGNLLFVILIWILLPYGLGRILGGSRSFGKFAYTSSLFITPMGVLYSIIGFLIIRLDPTLSTIQVFAFAVVGYYLVFVNLQAVMNLPKKKALLVLLYPIVIAVILFCCSLSIAVFTV